jgi:hypothetical protein
MMRAGPVPEITLSRPADIVAPFGIEPPTNRSEQDMEQAVVPGIAEVCAPGVDAWAAGSVRRHARRSIRSIRRDAVGAAFPPASLRAYRSKPYASRRPAALFAVLAVLASALTLLIMVALPWWIEMAPARALPAHTPSRITELAVLQRDSLLAVACWPRECFLTHRR